LASGNRGELEDDSGSPAGRTELTRFPAAQLGAIAASSATFVGFAAGCDWGRLDHGDRGWGGGFAELFLRHQRSQRVEIGHAPIGAGQERVCRLARSFVGRADDMGLVDVGMRG
jgi:hypothetical protein